VARRGIRPDDVLYLRPVNWVNIRTTAAFLVVALASCRDGRAPDRPPVRQPPGTPGPHSPADPAGTTPVPASDAAPDEGPPAGTADVVPVPPEVASQIVLEDVAHGLARPVLLTVAPNDARRRLFIVEQRGAIRFLENGKRSDKTFFAITGLATGNEQGLLGLAFHPAFATNGKLYVHYTTRDKASHIDEYRVSATDPDAVDMTTRRELLVVAQPYSNHNGGHLEFGPDGKLYTGLGDGGSANDPERNGQNPRTLLSKILRLDVDATTPKPESVHMGLRNPWRFSFDRKTGDLFIGDVGQNLWEYVFAVAGDDRRQHNFGWNVLEGSHCFDAATGGNKKTCDKTGFTLPIAEYGHDAGCSITGGIVYRGKALPALDGRYFYADYCTGLLRSLVWTRGVVREHWDWKRAIDKQGVLTQISSFGVDHDGELHVVTLTGSIYKLVPRG
jgi:glucose/arabinose dehydrogenase